MLNPYVNPGKKVKLQRKSKKKKICKIPPPRNSIAKIRTLSLLSCSAQIPSFILETHSLRGDAGGAQSGGEPAGARGISDGWAARREERQRPEVRMLSLAASITEIKACLCRITVPN